MRRADFLKSVGLFSGYVAFGSTGLMAKPLIVTPEEFAEEAKHLRSRHGYIDPGTVHSVGAFDRGGELLGVADLTGPRCLDAGDTLEVQWACVSR